MRGDHLLLAALDGRLQGPPPHARGSRVPVPARHTLPRPTPACAGITNRAPPPTTRRGAHPRMRGDHKRGMPEPASELGPPPHARGSRRQRRHLMGRRRPTPACAGITARRTRRQRTRPAHPRMRGDHGVEYMLDHMDGGPPPHARGSLADAREREARARPTPACAGITPRTPSCRSSRTAHPRMRGDHVSGVEHEVRATGPPPHARGSRVKRQVRGMRSGPTPACAGITTCSLRHVGVD